MVTTPAGDLSFRTACQPGLDLGDMSTGQSGLGATSGTGGPSPLAVASQATA